MNGTICCHVCGAPGIEFVPGFESLHRVTSDCRPWPKGGRLGVCKTCNCVQKVNDAAWQAEIQNIYETYSIYHQADGSEQSVFEQATGAAASRSSRLLAQLRSHVQLPESGRMLDMGCGNGAFLRAFSESLPSWSLAGTELNDKYQAIVEGIHGVKALYICALEKVPGKFDLISMIHVLEHIPGPTETLVSIGGKLETGGLLVIEVPDYSSNPFDLLIADHSSHFSAATLSRIVQKAGYELVAVTGEWVPKELTVVARKSQTIGTDKTPNTDAMQRVTGSVHWLQAAATEARRYAGMGAFGLFGTSIAATWLASELEGNVSFFVDEDQSRVGRTFMGKPVYHPKDVPAGSRVFIGLPSQISEKLKARLLQTARNYELILPPTLPARPQSR